MAHHRKRKTLRQRRKKRGLNALLAAALAVPGLGISPEASAQTPPEAPTIRLRYSGYKDTQSGDQHRITIKSPSVMIQAPLGAKDVLEASYTYDSVSGASPYYLSTVSGASGIGIRDNRRAADFKYTHIFERLSIGVGATVSDEDDYFSRSALADCRIWTPDKNTTFALGFSYDLDEISSSQDATFKDHRRAQGYLFGVTQVLSPNSIVQSNLSYAHGRGYHSDPYKPLDNRPRSRDGWAWLTRFNHYFEEYEASLHVDYRFNLDSWGVSAHMLEVAWYQPLGTKWLVRPSVRYYSQGGANFFSGDFPPSKEGEIFTADQRLGDFGSLGGGLKLIRDLGRGFSADVSFEAFTQKTGLKLGGSTRSAVEDFYGTFFSVGVAKAF